ncbi:hypothetical protein [Aeoliella sp.]|uniref:hypothetical protein n=1 Tax=Aeoliella sp. TaxID=2795800 RepID=UPI003CCB8B55
MATVTKLPRRSGTPIKFETTEELLKWSDNVEPLSADQSDRWAVTETEGGEA